LETHSSKFDLVKIEAGKMMKKKKTKIEVLGISLFCVRVSTVFGQVKVLLGKSKCYWASRGTVGPIKVLGRNC